MKLLWMGGLIVSLFGGVAGNAQANLIGTEVDVYGGSIQGGVTNIIASERVTVDADEVELFGFAGLLDVDIGVDSFYIKFINDFAFGTADFVGIAFNELSPGIKFVGFSGGSTNIPGFGFDDIVAYNDHLFGFNFSGLSVKKGDFVSAEVIIVPEPETLYLMAFGISLLSFKRSQKRNTV